MAVAQNFVNFCHWKVTQTAQGAIKQWIGIFEDCKMFQSIFKCFHTVFRSLNLYERRFWIVEFNNFWTKTTRLTKLNNIWSAVVDVVLARVHRLYQGFKIKLTHERCVPFRLIDKFKTFHYLAFRYSVGKFLHVSKCGSTSATFDMERKTCCLFLQTKFRDL